ncbi:hypothetical protein ABPG75_003038 [Micractinium tetrahymenae]
MQAQQGAAGVPWGAPELHQGLAAAALAAATTPQQLPGSGAGVCLPLHPSAAPPAGLQLAATAMHPHMQLAVSAVPLPALLPIPLLPAAPAATAAQHRHAAHQPMPAHLPDEESPPTAAAEEGAGESSGLGSGGATAVVAAGGSGTDDAAGAQPLGSGSLPPDSAQVQARLQALGATLLFEKVLSSTDVKSGKVKGDRVIVPKRHAEEHLPRLETKTIEELAATDLEGRSCQLRFTYWFNNTSEGGRMYVMEGTAPLMRRYRLLPGDVLVVARAGGEAGDYVVGGRRGEGRGKRAKKAGSKARKSKRRPPQPPTEGPMDGQEGSSGSKRARLGPALRRVVSAPAGPGQPQQEPLDSDDCWLQQAVAELEMELELEGGLGSSIDEQQGEEQQGEEEGMAVIEVGPAAAPGAGSEAAAEEGLMSLDAFLQQQEQQEREQRAQPPPAQQQRQPPHQQPPHQQQHALPLGAGLLQQAQYLQAAALQEAQQQALQAAAEQQAQQQALEAAVQQQAAAEQRAQQQQALQAALQQQAQQQALQAAAEQQAQQQQALQAALQQQAHQQALEAAAQEQRALEAAQQQQQQQQEALQASAQQEEQHTPLPDAAQPPPAAAGKAGSSDGSCEAPPPPPQRRSQRLREPPNLELCAGNPVLAAGSEGQGVHPAAGGPMAHAGQAAVSLQARPGPAAAAAVAPAVLEGVPVLPPPSQLAERQLAQPLVLQQPTQPPVVQQPHHQPPPQQGAAPAAGPGEPPAQHAADPAAAAPVPQSVLQTAIAAAAQAQKTVLEVAQLSGAAPAPPEVSAALPVAPAGGLLPALGSLPGLPRNGSLPSLPRIGSAPSLPRVPSAAALPRVGSFSGLAQVASAAALPPQAAPTAAEPAAAPQLLAQHSQHALHFAAPPVPRFSSTAAQRQPQPVPAQQQQQQPLVQVQMPGPQQAALLPVQQQAGLQQAAAAVPGLPSVASQAAKVAAAAAANLAASLPLGLAPSAASLPLVSLPLASLPFLSLPLAPSASLPGLAPLAVPPQPQQVTFAPLPLSAGVAAALASQPRPAGLVPQGGQLPAAQLRAWSGAAMLPPAPSLAFKRMPSVASSSVGQQPHHE